MFHILRSYLWEEGKGLEANVGCLPCVALHFIWNGLSLKLKLILLACILLACLSCQRLQKLVPPFPWCWGYRHMTPHPTNCMGGGDLHSGPCVCTAWILHNWAIPHSVFCVLHSHLLLCGIAVFFSGDSRALPFMHIMYIFIKWERIFFCYFL